jgi:hypothetical protein
MEGSRAASRVRGVLGRCAAFLGRYPILCLMLLTPGIPEYLSGSSALAGIVVSPLVFLLFFAANVGMYLPGALLIREARFRWHRGWATVLLLGAAYGILEEGVGLSTLFDPHASVVGGLGLYGHFLGVSWVWAAGVLMVHIVFSISIPLLLMDLALPRWRGRPLVGPRGVRVAFAVLGADIAALFLIVRFGIGFAMSPWILLGSLVAIAVLVLAARRAPSELLRPRSPGPPTARPRSFFALGFALFPATLIVEALCGTAGVPAILAMYAVLLGVARAWIGSREHDPHLVAFVAGALTPIALAGLLTGLRLPVVVAADVAAASFLFLLWRRAALPRPVPTGASVPRSPSGGPSVPAG